MKFSYKIMTLNLFRPIPTIIGETTSKQIALVEIEHEGISGIGEASPVESIGETIGTTIDFFKTLDDEHMHMLFDPQSILNHLEKMPAGNYAGKAAVDIAVHDWLAKRAHTPLWNMFKFDRNKIPTSSMSIYGTTMEQVEKRVRELIDFPILRINAGFDGDEEIISSIREITDKPIYVDANEGWGPKELALEKIRFLSTKHIEMIEQPLRANDLDGMRWLRGMVKIPIFADESVRSVKDITQLKGLFDGVNVKLMKCGGIKQVIQMIYTIKRIYEMKVMLDCTIESSVGISAAAQLLPLVHYCNLDGNMLVSNDPYNGVENHSGKIRFTHDPGIGVSVRGTYNPR